MLATATGMRVGLDKLTDGICDLVPAAADEQNRARPARRGLDVPHRRARPSDMSPHSQTPAPIPAQVTSTGSSNYIITIYIFR